MNSVFAGTIRAVAASVVLSALGAILAGCEDDDGTDMDEAGFFEGDDAVFFAGSMPEDWYSCSPGDWLDGEPPAEGGGVADEVPAAVCAGADDSIAVCVLSGSQKLEMDGSSALLGAVGAVEPCFWDVLGDSGYLVFYAGPAANTVIYVRACDGDNTVIVQDFEGRSEGITILQPAVSIRVED